VDVSEKPDHPIFGSTAALHWAVYAAEDVKQEKMLAEAWSQPVPRVGDHVEFLDGPNIDSGLVKRVSWQMASGYGLIVAVFVVREDEPICCTGMCSPHVRGEKT
jgi:hypothetical protein